MVVSARADVSCHIYETGLIDDDDFYVSPTLVNMRNTLSRYLSVAYKLSSDHAPRTQVEYNLGFFI